MRYRTSREWQDEVYKFKDTGGTPNTTNLTAKPHRSPSDEIVFENYDKCFSWWNERQTKSGVSLEELIVSEVAMGQVFLLTIRLYWEGKFSFQNIKLKSNETFTGGCMTNLEQLLPITTANGSLL